MSVKQLLLCCGVFLVKLSEKSMDAIIKMRKSELSAKSLHILERDRLESYKSWPFGPDALCSVIKMAEAGFYWCGNEREPDTVACFVCDKTLDGWEANDDPWAEHQKHAPQCAFVKLGRPEKDLTLLEFLGLVNKVDENVLIKSHAQIKKKFTLLCEKKREEMIKLFKS